MNLKIVFIVAMVLFLLINSVAAVEDNQSNNLDDVSHYSSDNCIGCNKTLNDNGKTDLYNSTVSNEKVSMDLNGCDLNETDKFIGLNKSKENNNGSVSTYLNDEFSKDSAIFGVDNNINIDANFNINNFGGTSPLVDVNENNKCLGVNSNMSMPNSFKNKLKGVKNDLMVFNSEDENLISSYVLDNISSEFSLGNNNLNSAYALRNRITPSGNTFESIQNAINSANNNDVINLQKTTYIGNKKEIGITNKNIVIEGNGASLDAKSLSRILDITSSKITIKNMGFINGKEKGGAIFISSSSNITIINCTFTNNFEEFLGGSGGGAIWDEGILNITHSKFTNNKGRNGGAICVRWGNANISDCIFENNTATYGGAIENWEGFYNLNNCTFINNSATDYGGAIENWVGFYNLNNCTFINNSATDYGGAIGCDGEGIVSNSTFINNSAFNRGGAIYIIKNTNIKGSNFVNNNATYEGGAIYSTAANDISNCSFVNNSANEGGALKLNSATNVIRNCSFVNNSAKMDGGAIYKYRNESYGGDFDIINCNFTNNQVNAPNAINPFLSYGGAICVKACKINITNSSFINNSASLRRGGAISCYLSRITTNVCSFVNNSAGSGAVYLEKSNGTFYDSEFIHNLARDNGGAIWDSYNHTNSDNNTINVFNCSFVNNSANDGGALRINSVNGVISNCSFVNNSANNGGGAIYVDSSVKILNMDNCNFMNNTATTRDGGAIWNLGSSNFNNCSFVNNSANSKGGAINNAYILNMMNCSFVNNNATNDGGAIESSGNVNSKIVLDKCEFINNSAKGNGGAISTTEFNDNITNCKFINNSATNEGGAIYSKNTNLSIEISNCDFTNNFAENNGGALLVGGDESNIKISNCNFTHNFLGENDYGNGGSICVVNKAVITISNSKFFNNYAPKWWGGAIHSEFKVILNNSTFVNNSAKTGGAISIWKGDYAMINQCTFINNSADTSIIYINKGNISNSVFVNNTPKNGLILSLAPGGSINNITLEYNWWGSNSNPSSSIESNTNIVNKNWILMTFVSGKKYIFASGDVNLTAALNKYTDGSNIYDFAGKLPVRNVSFSAVTGNFSFSNAELKNNSFTTLYSNSTVNNTLFAQIDNQVLNISTLVNGISVNVNPSVISIGQNTTVTVTVTGNVSNPATGIVIVVVNGTEYRLTLDNTGKASVNLGSNFTVVGLYNVTAKYLGDGDYTNAYYDIGSSFEIIKANVSSSISLNKTIVVGDNTTIDIILTGEEGFNVTGNVSFEINNEHYIVEIINGHGVLSFAWNFTAGNYTINSAYYTGNDYYNNCTLKIDNLIINKANASIDVVVSSEVITVGDDCVVSVVVTGKAGVVVSGNVTVFVNGANFGTYDLKDGAASFKLGSNLTAGSYVVVVVYNGNENYSSVSSANVSLVVNKVGANSTDGVNVTVVVSPEVITVGDDCVVSVVVSGKVGVVVSGNVTVFVNGANFGTYDLTNGKVEFSLGSNLTAGSYVVVVVYNGNENYSSVSSANVSLVVNKVGTNGTNGTGTGVNVTVVVSSEVITVGDDCVVSVVVTGKVGVVVSGNVTVFVNGANFGTYDLTNGKVEFSLGSNLTAGSYVIVVVYNGNENYSSVSSANVSLVVNKVGANGSNGTGTGVNVTVVVSPEVITVGDDCVVSVVVSGKVGVVVSGNVTVFVNGADFGTYDLTNGKVEFSLGSNLTAGSYVIVVVYNGNENYSSVSSANVSLVVNGSNKNTFISFNYVDGCLEIYLKDNVGNLVSNDSIKVLIDGVYYTIKLSNGKCVFNPGILDNGYYLVKVYYSGSNLYNPSENSTYVFIDKQVIIRDKVISKEPTSVDTGDLVVDVGGSVQIKVSSKNSVVDEGRILLIDNNNHVVGYGIVKSGIASFNITILEKGVYKVLIQYLGENKFENSNKTIQLTVNDKDRDKSVMMVAYNYTADFGVNGNFTARLVDKYGNPVVGRECILVLRNVLGETKTYWRTTNSEGYAKLLIELIPADWSITAFFPGDDVFNRSNNSTANLKITSLKNNENLLVDRRKNNKISVSA